MRALQTLAPLWTAGSEDTADPLPAPSAGSPDPGQPFGVGFGKFSFGRVL